MDTGKPWNRVTTTNGAVYTGPVVVESDDATDVIGGVSIEVPDGRVFDLPNHDIAGRVRVPAGSFNPPLLRVFDTDGEPLDDSHPSFSPDYVEPGSSLRVLQVCPYHPDNQIDDCPECAAVPTAPTPTDIVQYPLPWNWALADTDAEPGRRVVAYGLLHAVTKEAARDAVLAAVDTAPYANWRLTIYFGEDEQYPPVLIEESPAD